MTPEGRDQMLELCRLIHRETDISRLSRWILELNEMIRRKVQELKKKQQ